MVRFAFAFIAAMAAPSVAQQSRFISLGPGTSASGVSSDGTVVVGSRSTPSGPVVFRWTESTGLLDLGPGSNPSISADGSVITANSGGGFSRWTAQTGMVTLGNGTANALSADGSTVVGRTHPLLRAFHWTQSGGAQVLPFPAGTADGEHNAWAVSGDGSVVAGTLITSGRAEPFRWTQATGMVGLGRVPGGFWDSNATVMTPDGDVIFGAARTSAGYDTYRWTAQTGMVPLGVAGGGLLFPLPMDVTPDGEILVGDTLGNAFVWRLGSGPAFVRDVMEERFGLNLDGYDLTQSRGISADGRTIVGVGTDWALSSNVGWVAILSGPIPAPGSMVVIAAGALLAARRRRATGLAPVR